MNDWRKNAAEALAGAGVSSRDEFAASHPGKHLWFDFKGDACCLVCGGCKPADEHRAAASRCRGVARIALR